jgi:hypothetical protein
MEGLKEIVEQMKSLIEQLEAQLPAEEEEDPMAEEEAEEAPAKPKSDFGDKKALMVASLRSRLK